MSGKQFLYIIIATLITVVIWVGFDIIHSRSMIQTPIDIAPLLEPIDPSIDQEAINEL